MNLFYLLSNLFNPPKKNKRNLPVKRVQSGKIFNIIYIGGSGKTEREIKVKYFYPKLDYYVLISHCYLREAERTFKTNGIQRIVDIETGEEIKDADKYFGQLYKNAL